MFGVSPTSSQTRQLNSRGCVRQETGQSEAPPVKFRELIGVALSIIGLITGLVAVKAGASLLVILGIALIVTRLAIVNWNR